jgi:hypothetical protein
MQLSASMMAPCRYNSYKQILEGDSFDLIKLIPDKTKGGAVTVVSFSWDSSKCFVGFESGSFVIYETNDWKLVQIAGNQSFDEPISAADWALDPKFLVIEDATQQTKWFKVTGNTMKAVPISEEIKIKDLKWKNGSLYSSWQVLSNDLDQWFP